MRERERALNLNRTAKTSKQLNGMNKDRMRIKLSSSSRYFESNALNIFYKGRSSMETIGSVS